MVKINKAAEDDIDIRRTLVGNYWYPIWSHQWAYTRTLGECEDLMME
jgi:hypothetical protein